MMRRPATDVDGAVLHDSSSVTGHRARMIRVGSRVVLGLGAVMVLLGLAKGHPPSQLWVLTLPALVTALMVGAALRRRLEVTAGELRIRTVAGLTIVPRSAVDRVVHVEDLQHPSVPGGFVAVLDRSGRRLWCSATRAWPEETVEALLAVAREPVTIGRTTVPEVREAWPGLLPWTWSHPARLFVGTVLVIALLVGCGIAVAAALVG